MGQNCIDTFHNLIAFRCGPEEVEPEKRGTSDKAHRGFNVVQSGQFYDDSPLADFLNVRFRNTVLIHALFDDASRPFHGVCKRPAGHRACRVHLEHEKNTSLEVEAPFDRAHLQIIELRLVSQLQSLALLHRQRPEHERRVKLVDSPANDHQQQGNSDLHPTWHAWQLLTCQTRNSGAPHSGPR